MAVEGTAVLLSGLLEAMLLGTVPIVDRDDRTGARKRRKEPKSNGTRGPGSNDECEVDEER